MIQRKAKKKKNYEYEAWPIKKKKSKKYDIVWSIQFRLTHYIVYKHIKSYCWLLKQCVYCQMWQNIEFISDIFTLFSNFSFIFYYQFIYLYNLSRKLHFFNFVELLFCWESIVYRSHVANHIPDIVLRAGPWSIVHKQASFWWQRKVKAAHPHCQHELDNSYSGPWCLLNLFSAFILIV